MSLYPLGELFKFKKNNIAVFLGSGPSINRISNEEWNKIRECDIWTINNWVYHPFIVPHFYHIEVKWYDYPIVERRINEKREQYKNVKYLFQRGKNIRMKDGRALPLHMVVGDMPYKFEYSMVKRDPKRKHIPFNADYQMVEKALTKSYDISITLMFELLYRFGYERVILYGVDLGSSYYFWTGGDPKYGEVHHQTNKAHEGKDPKLPHATHQIKDFIVDFNKRWMLPNKREIVTGHIKTLLYPEIRKMSILEV